MTKIPIDRWRPVASDIKPALLGPGDYPNPLPAHVGLWLDRMLNKPFDKADSKWTSRKLLYRAAIKALSGSNTPAVVSYRHLFERWRQALKTESKGTTRLFYELVSTRRLLLHSASNETVTDGSLELHHSYGVPYLPGSALKGLTRSALMDLAEATSDPVQRQRLETLTRELLGHSEPKASGATKGANPAALAALVDFHDALWMPLAPPSNVCHPSGEDWSPLALDVVNPHHPDYYTQTTNRPLPKPTDSPVPVHRLTVNRGARFLVTLEFRTSSVAEKWTEWLATNVLFPALRNKGLGSRGSSGFGRFLQPAQIPTLGKKTAANTPSPVSDAPVPLGFKPAQVAVVDAGSFGLEARMANGQVATRSGNPAIELINSLPDIYRNRLRGWKDGNRKGKKLKLKQRKVALLVELEIADSRLRIREMKPPDQK